MHQLGINTALAVIDKFDRKVSWGVVVREGKGFTLFIAYKDMDDINKIEKSLDNSGLLIDGATETLKHEINKKVDFLVLW